jgi:hypothetical protein
VWALFDSQSEQRLLPYTVVNRLISVTVKCDVFFAVRTEFLNIIRRASSSKVEAQHVGSVVDPLHSACLGNLSLKLFASFPFFHCSFLLPPTSLTPSPLRHRCVAIQSKDSARNSVLYAHLMVVISVLEFSALDATWDLSLAWDASVEIRWTEPFSQHVERMGETKTDTKL